MQYPNRSEASVVKRCWSFAKAKQQKADEEKSSLEEEEQDREEDEEHSEEEGHSGELRLRLISILCSSSS